MVARVDVIGFSMGSLVSRYWIQRQRGRQLVRRFRLNRRPAAGNVAAYGSSLRRHPRRCRPEGVSCCVSSPNPTDVWREVELHCLWTPFDLTILPGRSGVLPGARSVRRFPVLFHRHMVRDRRVISAVVAILTR